MSVPSSSPNLPRYPAPVQVTRDDGPPGGAAAHTDSRPVPTEPVPTFEPGELFGDSWEGDGERTVVAALPFEIRPRFTGRKTIVDRLVAHFVRAVNERELAFVVISAEPGMGKSRLVTELGRAAMQRDAATRVLSGSPDESGTPHAAIGRLLASRFGITAVDAPAEARDKIIGGRPRASPRSRT